MFLSAKSVFWGSAALLGGALLFYALWPRLAATDIEQRALAEGRTLIVYWDRHSGHEHQARLDLFDEFNRSQDKVYVRAVAIGYNAGMEKLLTATAGGAPPDLCSIDSTYMAQLAPQGVLMPLDDFMAATPGLHQEDFFPHVWRMAETDGHVWGVPTTTDVYCLLWNKTAFREVGLDPEKPPKTIEELEEYAAKLTQWDPDSGAIQQMGMVPWTPWDMTHLWGVMFGGAWIDEKTGLVNITENPAILRSFEWQSSFTIKAGGQKAAAYAVPPERIASVSKGFFDYFSANNPFYTGKVAMIIEGEWQVTFIPKYAPSLDWGVAPIPRPEGAQPLGYGPSCVVDVIPATSRRPEAAKALLRWFHSARGPGQSSPVSDYNLAIHNIPPRPAEAREDRFMDNPKFRVFVSQLLDHEVAAMPVMPVAQYMMDQLERMREQVVFGLISPQAALEEAERSVNREVTRVRDLLARSAAS